MKTFSCLTKLNYVKLVGGYGSAVAVGSSVSSENENLSSASDEENIAAL